MSGTLPADGPPTGDPSVVVHAAGGVVWRRGEGGVEVVLVHRPRYDDWSLPKGKVDAGEADEAAAVREVEEESTLRARIGPELIGTTYIDRSGRTKSVRYWAMTAAGARPGAANEVDDARWVPMAEARRLLSYDRDRPVLDSLGSTLDALTGLRVECLDHVVLRVDDVAEALGFWCDVLGLEGVRVEAWRRGEVPFPSVRVDGRTIVDLVPAGSPAGGDGSGPSAGEVDHVCLVVEADVGALAACGVLDVADGPVRRFGARGEGTSIYVRPTGGGPRVELRSYGPGNP